MFNLSRHIPPKIRSAAESTVLRHFLIEKYFEQEDEMNPIYYVSANEIELYMKGVLEWPDRR